MSHSVERALRRALRYVDHLDVELVRTDKHELQHALAREVEVLRSIARRLQAAADG